MFVRTKDGVYDSENDDIVKIDGKYKKCYVQKDTGDTCFKDIEVINVSENLEELCDKFIDKTQHYIIKNKEILSTIRTKEQLKNNEIYGAIWTDKGLIYVAKMNESGDLELI